MTFLHIKKRLMNQGWAEYEAIELSKIGVMSNIYRTRYDESQYRVGIRYRTDEHIEPPTPYDIIEGDGWWSAKIFTDEVDGLNNRKPKTPERKKEELVRHINVGKKFHYLWIFLTENNQTELSWEQFKNRVALQFLEIQQQLIKFLTFYPPFKNNLTHTISKNILNPNYNFEEFTIVTSINPILQKESLSNLITPELWPYWLEYERKIPYWDFGGLSFRSSIKTLNYPN